MRKTITTILLLVSTIVNSQSKIICELYDPNISQSLDLDLIPHIELTKQSLIDQVIYYLLSSTGLERNFKTIQCESNCTKLKPTAIHSDSIGRVLYLDNEFDYSKTSDSVYLSRMFHLAHEVGHHVLEHNSLREERCKYSREVCDTRSKKYDKEGCKNKLTYQHYRRKNEVQADRFAGYYFGTLGGKLTYLELYLIQESQLEGTNNPNIAERLENVRQGYFMAQEDIKFNRKLNKDKLIRYKAYEGSNIIQPDKNSDMNGLCQKVFIDPERYKRIQESSIEILQTQVVDNCLRLKLKFRGCEDSKISLIDAGLILETFPPQRSLKIELVNSNSCNKEIIKNYFFDLLLDKAGGLMVFNLWNPQKKRKPFYDQFKVEY